MAALLSLVSHEYLIAGVPLIVLFFAVMGLPMMGLTFKETRSQIVDHGSQRYDLALLIRKLSSKSRLIEVALDLALIPMAYFGALLLRLDFHLSEHTVSATLGSLPWIIGITYAAFVSSSVYQSIWPHASFADALRLAQGALFAGIFLRLFSFVHPLQPSGSIVILFAILLFNLLLATRLSFRLLRQGVVFAARDKERVLIVGAGELAEAAARYQISRPARSSKLAGFVDDDKFKLGKLVCGWPVLGTLDDLDKIRAECTFSHLIIAANLSAERTALVCTFVEQHKVTAHRFSVALDDMKCALELVADNQTIQGITAANAALKSSL
jgi:FlaA1/EpsC-like NDP-sugar epimerase